MNTKRVFKDKFIRNRHIISAVITAALVASSTVLTGCGKEEYVKQEFTASSQGSGFRSVPAKVDIVFVPDNSGSMNTALSTVEGQISGFVSSLRSKYWDYRVAKSLMIGPAPIQQVLVNPDFMGANLPDGTPNPDSNPVPASQAITNPSLFLPLVTSLSVGGIDNTYSNTYNNLFNATAQPGTSSGLLRKDVMLAIIVLTNGAEYSVDPNHNGMVNTTQLANWANQYKNNLRSSSGLVRFYPISAKSATSNGCQGGPAYIGSSYSKMVTDGYLKGIAFDICDMGALSNVLSSIESDLNVTRGAFVHEYIVLKEEPLVGTIHVFKNGTEIPESASNGWTYEGHKSVYTITGIQETNGSITPFNSDYQTGYTIHLNGSAKMIGNDYPTITYSKP